MKLLFLFFFTAALAHEPTGSFQAEFFSQAMKGDSSTESHAKGERKSGFLGAALSAIVPGAGEVYAGSYLRAVPFVVAEATGLALMMIYNKKGDDQTVGFQNYADEEIYAVNDPLASQGRSRWSIVRYADWLNRNRNKLAPGVEPIPINANNTMKDWDRVNISDLNRMEDRVRSGELMFSHRLEAHGRQQYYELIGKYLQFVRGWDDAHSEADTSGNPFLNMDKPLAEQGTEHFRGYSVMRGKANDLYNVAQLILGVIIFNHVASAVDAALAVRSYNHELSAGLGTRSLPDGATEVYTMASLRVRW